MGGSDLCVSCLYVCLWISQNLLCTGYMYMHNRVERTGLPNTNLYQRMLDTRDVRCSRNL